MLKSKTALITGASRGIGREIAIKMAQNGANIAVVYYDREPTAAEETCKILEELGVKVKAYLCDVSDFESSKQIVNSIISDFGGIDILVNNAGITRDKLILQMTEDDFDLVLKINLKGSFNMIKHTFSQFAKKRQGRIINISSVSGLMGNAGQANYSSSKAGLIGLTKTTAKELASRGVTCNAIAPGFIETEMTAILSDEVKAAAKETIPMKRMGTTDDIANLALFLASDGANYITGEVIRIDGGMCM